ncbi:MAG: mechanosensitive ion channel family protein [Tannerella sp.]|jgi:small-conductance mechanosensitive channel|nr:mechanosensitive ion channel family protein [Tannerella sp.]
MKNQIFLIGLFCCLNVAPNHAQQDSTGLQSAIDAIVYQDTIPNHTLSADSPVNDNSEAIHLMIQSNIANLAVSIRESVIAELLQNTENTHQRLELERQRGELYKEDSLRRIKQQHRIDSLKKTAIGAPVLLKQDTLYYIFANIGAISASERAKLQSEKILHTAKIFLLKTDSLHIAEGNETSDIVYQHTILASVTEHDALWMNTTRNALAIKHINSIVNAIAVYKKQTGLWNTIRIIGLCLLLVGGQLALFMGIRFLFKHVIRRAIIKRKKKLFKGIIFRNDEILNPKRQMRLCLGLVRAVKYFIYFISFYLTIILLFSILPPTQKVADLLFGWILNPIKAAGNSMIDFLPNLFHIIIILISVRYILKFAKYISNEIEEKRLVIPGFYPDWSKATLNIFRFIVYALAFVLIFQLLPWSDSAVFQGVSVFIGLLISLGSTGVISNLISGLVITYMRPFVKGDRIRIGETYGDIVEKTPFVIRILTPKNEVVTVPNATILSSNVVNYSAKTKDNKDAGVVVNTIVEMGYEVPWAQVHHLLIDAALRTPHVLHRPSPFVLQTALNDFSISYQINAYTKEPSKIPFIYSELYKNIQDVFRDAGIELMTLPYQAFRKGNQTTIPPVFNSSEKTMQ